MRYLTFPLALAFAQVAFAAPTGLLNDTGQDTCYDGTNLVACATANSGDAANPRQDGRFGRDAAAAAGVLTKIGAGAAGFDYTKIANNGSTLAAGAALGSAADDWACTRDNVTGLTWEVKTATTTDLRYSGHYYTWYNSDGATNGGDAGDTGGNTCNATLPGNLCNTQAFVAAVNAAALCGYSDWRLPSRRELVSIIHRGTSSPAIDGAHFPSTGIYFYWSSTNYVPDPTIAWFVGFYDGVAYIFFKTNGLYVRLVRSGQ